MSDSEEDVAVERQVKISLVGEPSTGKSMLCARYLGLQTGGGATQGAEVLLGECPPARASRPPVPLKLCDVAGAARDSPMLANYLYASHIVLLVYDVTNLQSFERLGHWLDRVTEILSTDSSNREADTEESELVLALFGNKCDLEHQRAVRMANVQVFANENGLTSFTGSARTGENVNSTILTLVSTVLGVPINKSLFINSTIVKAELAPQIRNPRIDRTTSKDSTDNTQKESIQKKSSKNSKVAKDNTNEISIKKHKKSMKDLKWKASSAVCNLQ